MPEFPFRNRTTGKVEVIEAETYEEARGKLQMITAPAKPAAGPVEPLPPLGPPKSTGGRPKPELTKEDSDKAARLLGLDPSKSTPGQMAQQVIPGAALGLATMIPVPGGRVAQVLGKTALGTVGGSVGSGVKEKLEGGDFVTGAVKGLVPSAIGGLVSGGFQAAGSPSKATKMATKTAGPLQNAPEYPQEIVDSLRSMPVKQVFSESTPRGLRDLASSIFRRDAGHVVNTSISVPSAAPFVSPVLGPNTTRTSPPVMTVEEARDLARKVSRMDPTAGKAIMADMRAGVRARHGQPGVQALEDANKNYAKTMDLTEYLEDVIARQSRRYGGGQNVVDNPSIAKAEKAATGGKSQGNPLTAAAEGVHALLTHSPWSIGRATREMHQMGSGGGEVFNPAKVSPISSGRRALSKILGFGAGAGTEAGTSELMFPEKKPKK